MGIAFNPFLFEVEKPGQKSGMNVVLKSKRAWVGSKKGIPNAFMIHSYKECEQE